jgi:hypothetical protein
LGGEIKLAQDAVVSGICATAGGKIILGKNAVCSGGVDTSGSSPALVPLQTFASAGARACPPGGISEGDLTLKKNGAAPLTANSGFNEFDYTKIKMGKNSFLTIAGPADALVVINDSGSLNLVKGATIAVGSGGLTAANVLVVATSVKSTSGTVNGTLISGGTCNLVETRSLMASCSARVRPRSEPRQASAAAL